MVFCSECGAKLEEDALFCTECGTALTSIKRGIVIHRATVRQEKSAGIAAISNFLIWGVGYYYLGIKRVSGLPWFILTILVIILNIIYFMYFMRYGEYNIVILLLAIVVSIVLAIDAYQKAEGRPGFIPSEGS